MVSNTSPSLARGLVSTALALCIATSAAVQAQDIGGSTWNGWTDRGSSVSTGVYANGGLANDYQVYTAVFLYNPSNPIPGTTSGFTAGHKILAVGIRNNASTLGAPVLLLDSGNDSFFPAASTSTTGNSSFDFDASTGDSKWSFFLPGSGLSDLAIRNQSGTDYVATSTGDWGTFGAPGVRGTNPATGVWKVFIDLNQVFSEYGALGSRGANPGLAPLGSSVAIALSMFEASAAPAETGTESVVRNLSLNTAPVGTNDTYSMDEDTTLNAGSAPPALGVLPLGVLSNDTDAESDVLTATLVTGPANGSLTLNSDGSFSYTPNANWFGVDTFTYKANDGSLDSGTTTVTITVNDVFDPTMVNVLGFFQPVDNRPLVNTARAGRTVPLKWRITNTAGAGIQVPGLTVSVVTFLTSTGSGVGDEIEVYSGASGLQYLGDGNYQFNWATPTTYANQERTVRVTLTASGFVFGPATREADFRFRK